MGTTYHEPATELQAETRETHRALTSLVEELEAVDWYNQRISVTGDEDLKTILVHNRDEEIEHAAMCLEYLRRRIPEFNQQLRTYLFTNGPIPAGENGHEEEAQEAGEAGGKNESDAPADGSLEIGRNQGVKIKERKKR